MLRRLARVEVVRDEKGNWQVVVTLRHARDWDLAEVTLHGLGAANDGTRGDEVFAYHGQTIVLQARDAETDMTSPARPRTERRLKWLRLR